MTISARDLIYMKDFSEETKFKLLRIIDSSTWLEEMFDLMKELSEEQEACRGPEREECEKCLGEGLNHECGYTSIYNDQKALNGDLENLEAEKENLEQKLKDLKLHIGELAAMIKNPNKEPEEYKNEAMEIASEEAPLETLDFNMRIYKSQIEKGLRTMLTNVKVGLYGNNDPEKFNRYTSIKENIEPLEELEELLPEYLLYQKRKLMDKIKKKKGLTVGGIELPSQVSI